MNPPNTEGLTPWTGSAGIGSRKVFIGGSSVCIGDYPFYHVVDYYHGIYPDESGCPEMTLAAGLVGIVPGLYLSVAKLIRDDRLEC